jgi:hypothetical protein
MSDAPLIEALDRLIRIVGEAEDAALDVEAEAPSEREWIQANPEIFEYRDKLFEMRKNLTKIYGQFFENEEER